jgi:hypothetical protein
LTRSNGSPPAFLPARPITQADLAALAERVRRRVLRWFRMQRLLAAAAAADMLAWVNSGFSGSHSLTAMCRAISRVLSTCCGTAPGRLLTAVENGGAGRSKMVALGGGDESR